MYNITKDFDFCYCHRVYTQNLDKTLSCGAKNKCLALHGHNGIIRVTLGNEILDDRGFVIDFNELNFVKKFIDDNLDHKFIIDMNDPIFSVIACDPIREYYKDNCVSFKDNQYFKTIDLTSELPDNLRELAESFTIMDFIPTSENLSKWLFNIIDDKMKQFGIKIVSVQFFETPKSNSLYRGE